jgi:hypothetical protein
MFGKIERFKVDAEAKKTPLNIKTFFDLDAVYANVLKVDGATTSTGNRKLTRSPVIKKGGTSPVSNDIQTSTDDETYFYMKGKTTLFEMINTEIKGTIKTLLNNEKQIHEFIEHDIIQRM